MRRWFPALALALAALLAGCASAGPSPGPGTPPTDSASPSPSESAEPVPRFIGPADDGSTFAMTVGSTTTLRATDAAASDPVLEGRSVLVIPTVNVAPSAGREWEVRAVEPGVSTIRGTDGDAAWTITLSVTE